MNSHQHQKVHEETTKVSMKQKDKEQQQHENESKNKSENNTNNQENHVTNENIDISEKNYDLPVDSKQGDKANTIRFLSFARPHMRGFYFAFACYFLGNFLWFTITPLQTELRDSIDGMDTDNIWTSNIFNILGCLVGRLMIGPICDRYGAKRPMAAVLIFVSNLQISLI